jgi:hypothetical protein
LRLNLLKGGTAEVDSRSQTLNLLSFPWFGAFSLDRSRSIWRREIRYRATWLLFFSVLLYLYAPFSLFVCARIHGHGQRMDVQGIEAGSFLPGSCDKICCNYEKASSEAEARTHHLSV